MVIYIKKKTHQIHSKLQRNVILITLQ